MNAITPARINIVMLRDTLANMPDEAKPNGSVASFFLSTSVLKHYFGQEWLDQYLSPTAGKPTFLNIDSADPDPMRRELTAFRVIDLAEVIYNLQFIPVFSECIAKIRNGDIEGTFAELDLGRMLYLNQVPFRFVVAQGVKGRDYDVEVEYPDRLIACAEAKCSIERVLSVQC